MEIERQEKATLFLGVNLLQIRARSLQFQLHSGELVVVWKARQ